MAIDELTSFAQSRSETHGRAENPGSCRSRTVRLPVGQRCILPTTRKCTARQETRICPSAFRKAHPPKARSTYQHPQRMLAGRCRMRRAVSRIPGRRLLPGSAVEPASIGDAESARMRRTLSERIAQVSSRWAAIGQRTTRHIRHSSPAYRRRACRASQDPRPNAPTQYALRINIALTLLADAPLCPTQGSQFDRSPGFEPSRTA